ncbi:MAG: PaaI family thioesterase [Treponema sp.]|nr:PaaI family thioesterase [Treponema sp.]
MTPKEYAELYFKNDRFAMQTTGIEIVDVDSQYAKCSLKIDGRHLNAAGTVMGGAVFTLADFTFALASNPEGQWTVSVSSTIEYLNAAKGPVLYCEAKCLKNGRSVCFYEMTVTEPNGKVIARILTNGFKK